MLQTAVIAYGFSATTFHIPFLLADPNYSLNTIVTSKVDSVRLEHPDVNLVETIEQVDVEAIDVVIITTPNSLHFSQAEFFLQRGCHVVLEKPFVLSSEDAKALKKLASEKGVQLTVFQNRRWDGDFLTVQSLMDSKSVGKVKRFVSRFDRFRPNVRQRWREQAVPGGGILWDLGPHLLDQAVCLFGKPVWIEANVLALRDGAVVDDNFEIRMGYEDCQVQLGSSSFQAGPNARFQIEGTEGSFIKYGLDVQEDALKKGVSVLDDQWGREPSEDWGILYQESSSRLIATKPGGYQAFWYQLRESIVNHASAPVPLDDSVLVIHLIELAIEANKSGRRIMLN